ncbi:MAG TPA: hypothetical protein VIR65_00110 [Rhizorhapis sp.]
MRIILEAETDFGASLALRAAQSLLRDGHQDCIYAYGDKGEWAVYAKRTKSGVSSRVASTPGTQP